MIKQYWYGGKFLKTLQEIYTNHKVYIKTSEGLLEPFETTTGVKQGCTFSPLLYNLFVTDLDRMFVGNSITINNKLFEGSCDPVEINNKELNCLSWADDLLLVSTTKNGLQNALNRSAEYYELHGLTINHEKTKIIIFNKRGLKLLNEGNFTMNGSL